MYIDRMVEIVIGWYFLSEISVFVDFFLMFSYPSPVDIRMQTQVVLKFISSEVIPMILLD